MMKIWKTKVQNIFGVITTIGFESQMDIFKKKHKE